MNHVQNVVIIEPQIFLRGRAHPREIFSRETYDKNHSRTILITYTTLANAFTKLTVKHLS